MSPSLGRGEATDPLDSWIMYTVIRFNFMDETQLFSLLKALCFLKNSGIYLSISESALLENSLYMTWVILSERSRKV